MKPEREKQLPTIYILLLLRLFRGPVGLHMPEHGTLKILLLQAPIPKYTHTKKKAQI
jgi:hypothetical protein